jgi:hypothetical protein
VWPSVCPSVRWDAQGPISFVPGCENIPKISFAEISAAGGPADQWDALPSAGKARPKPHSNSNSSPNATTPPTSGTRCRRQANPTLTLTLTLTLARPHRPVGRAAVGRQGSDPRRHRFPRDVGRDLHCPRDGRPEALCAPPTRTLTLTPLTLTLTRKLTLTLTLSLTRYRTKSSRWTARSIVRA